MAQAKTVTVYECDGCGRLIQPTKVDEKPQGFHGTVKEYHPDGNSETAVWFAHHDRCIKGAVMNVLGIEYNR